MPPGRVIKASCGGWRRALRVVAHVLAGQRPLGTNTREWVTVGRDVFGVPRVTIVREA